MIRRGGRNVGGPVPVRDRSSPRHGRSPRCPIHFRQMICRRLLRLQRHLRRQLLRSKRCALLASLMTSSCPYCGIRPSVVRGHRVASSEWSPCPRRRPCGRNHGDPSPRRSTRPVRMCAGRREQNRAGGRRPDCPVCSSLLPRPLRLLRLRWRRPHATCGLRGECAGPPGVGAERVATEPKIHLRGCCRRIGCPTDRRMRASLSGTSSRNVGRRTARSSGSSCSGSCSGRNSCGTGEGSPPRSAVGASRDAGSQSAEAARAENSAAARSTAVSSRFHWRRCRRGTGGERRRGADDLLSGNRGRSHAVRACQGETLASCLLLKNCHLVQYGPLAVPSSGAGRTSAIGFPIGVPAKI